MRIRQAFFGKKVAVLPNQGSFGRKERITVQRGDGANQWETGKKIWGNQDLNAEARGDPQRNAEQQPQRDRSRKRHDRRAEEAQQSLQSIAQRVVFCRAALRIRALRRGLQGLRGAIYSSAATFSAASDELSGVQKAGAAGLVHFQSWKVGFHFGRQKGRVYGFEACRQRGIRETMMEI